MSPLIDPASIPAPVGNYAQAFEVPPGSRLVFISGQIPERDDGSVPADFDGQCRLVWSHLGAILAGAGMSYANLVKVTTFLADRSHVDRNGAIRREALGAHRPALTVVAVDTLDPRWLLEIEAVAAG